MTAILSSRVTEATSVCGGVLLEAADIQCPHLLAQSVLRLGLRSLASLAVYPAEDPQSLEWMNVQ